jgi:hypothetical protein
MLKKKKKKEKFLIGRTDGQTHVQLKTIVRNLTKRLGLIFQKGLKKTFNINKSLEIKLKYSLKPFLKVQFQNIFTYILRYQ